MTTNHEFSRGKLRVALVLAIPAGLAVIASLWPLEPDLVFLACLLLVLFTFVAVLSCRSVRQLLLGITVIAVLLSIARSNWPLRVAYAVSRPSFERAADQMEAGGALHTPSWVGVFRIRKAELDRNGVVCLWTSDHPAGATGFVLYGSDDLPFNLSSHLRLDDRWQFISED